jgi:hypothetical protein
MDDKPYCCRCGTQEAEVYWGPAHSLDESYWLCQDCQDSVLYLWIMEHYSLVEQFRRERATAP